MKKLFLASAGLFIAATAQADTPPVTATTPATPVMMTGETMTAAPARRGLFGRLRNRSMYTPTTYSTPMTTATPAPTVAPTPTAPSTPAPMPMKLSEAAPMNSGVVQTGGTTPMTTPGMVVTADATMVPMATATPTRRMGMFRMMRSR